jgi:hypothetical protein
MMRIPNREKITSTGRLRSRLGKSAFPNRDRKGVGAFS